MRLALASDVCAASGGCDDLSRTALLFSGTNVDSQSSVTVKGDCGKALDRKMVSKGAPAGMSAVPISEQIQLYNERYAFLWNLQMFWPDFWLDLLSATEQGQDPSDYADRLRIQSHWFIEVLWRTVERWRAESEGSQVQRPTVGSMGKDGVVKQAYVPKIVDQIEVYRRIRADRPIAPKAEGRALLPAIFLIDDFPMQIWFAYPPPVHIDFQEFVFRAEPPEMSLREDFDFTKSSAIRVTTHYQDLTEYKKRVLRECESQLDRFMHTFGWQHEQREKKLLDDSKARVSALFYAGYTEEQIADWENEVNPLNDGDRHWDSTAVRLKRRRFCEAIGVEMARNRASLPKGKKKQNKK